MNELVDIVVSSSRLVICYVDLSVLLGKDIRHAVIVSDIDTQLDQIHVIDPKAPPLGQRIWSFDLFEIAWRRARYQTILITPPNPSS
jgi:hypothetical protein